MKFLRYITYLLYSYYDKGSTKNTAYLRAIMTVTMLFYLTVMLLIVIFDLDNYIPINTTDSKGIRYFKIGMFILPISIILYYTVTESKIKMLREKLDYDHYDKEFYHRALLFVYLLVVFILVMTIAVLRKNT